MWHNVTHVSADGGWTQLLCATRKSPWDVLSPENSLHNFSSCSSETYVWNPFPAAFGLSLKLAWNEAASYTNTDVIVYSRIMCICIYTYVFCAKPFDIGMPSMLSLNVSIATLWRITWTVNWHLISLKVAHHGPPKTSLASTRGALRRLSKWTPGLGLMPLL